MFIGNLFRLPSAAGKIQDMVGELASRRSLLLLLPEWIDDNLVWEELKNELWRKDLWVEEISLEELPQNQPPLFSIMHELGWPQEDSGALPELPHILYLQVSEKLPPTVLKAWLELLAFWAKRSQSQEAPMSSTALCLFIRGDAVLSHIPSEDVRLAIYWWWGVPAAIEIHLLCRMANRKNELDLEQRWREEILPSLCANDWHLLEYLWDKIFLDLDELTQHLADYADFRNWNRKLIEDLGATQIAHRHGTLAAVNSLQPPKEYWGLWSQGLLLWTPEFGPELHIAAHVVLGDQTGVNNKFWRGQAKFILPIINQVRLDLYHYFRKRYGADWPLRWSAPEDQNELQALMENPMSVQWGYLCWCLNNVYQLNSDRRWLPLANEARTIRNDLSHNRPINYPYFRHFFMNKHKIML
ncbi:MAG: hypothetical protein FJ025_04190 [Chloroflexi bacterium]|nr:hypothetical protein [Chloroflexota bacterium]